MASLTSACNCPVLASTLEVVGCFDAEGNAAGTPSRAVAFAGIADPDGFKTTLANAGVIVESFHPFPDHHPYADREWEALAAEAKATRLPLVTTEKDLARLRRHLAAKAMTIVVLRVESVVHGREAVLAAVARAMERR